MNFYMRITIIFLIVMILSIIPLPDWADIARPAFVFMVWIYLRIFMPERFSLFFLVLNGILLDCLLYTPIGMHSFAMLLSLWLINARARRFVFFNLVQQMLLVFSLTVFYLFLLLGAHLFMGNYINAMQPFFIGVSTALVWPWLKVTLDDSLRRVKLTA